VFRLKPLNGVKVPPGTGWAPADAIGAEIGRLASRAYFLGKIEEMNASTWAPGEGLGGPRRQSIRLSRLARAWRWLGPGDEGRSTAPVLTATMEEGAAVFDRAARSDPVACAGAERKGAAVSRSWPVPPGSSMSLADVCRSPLGSTPGWASETVDRNGCVMPMIEPRRAHPTMTGAPTSTDTRREPKVGGRMRLLFSSLTMECGAVACPRLNSLRVHVLAKNAPARGFWWR
jgi:hypothetical protein